MTDITLPTATQVQTLAAKIPPTPPTPPPIPHLLRPLLRLCRTQWIRDFLFTPSPIHLAHLTAPALANTAFTCRLNATRVEPPAALPNPYLVTHETHHLHSSYLFAPAFTADSLTAGFGVMDCAVHLGPFWLFPHWQPACKRKLNFRFVRDTNTHSVFEVFEAPEEDCMMVFHSQFVSTTQSRTSTAVFRRSRLLRALRAERGVLENVARALQFFMEDEQLHACKVCHVPAAVRCECAMPRHVPKHPFDNACFRRSMLLHLGVYESVGNKMMYVDGRMDRQVVLGTRVALQGFVDPVFVRGISSWVTANHLKGLTADPRQSLLQITYGEDDPEGARWQEVQSDWIDNAVLAEDTAASNRSSHDILGDPLDGDLADERASGMPNSTVSTSSGIPASSVQFSLVDADDGQETADLAVDVAADNVDKPVSRTDELVEDELWWSRRCEGVGPQPYEQAAVSSSLTDTEAPPNGSVSNCERTGDDEKASDSPAQNCAITKTSGEAALLASRQRAQQRRERNRAAARRSNMKRKVFRETLVSDLTLSREQMGSLRRKELSLRQENLRLRKLIMNEM